MASVSCSYGVTSFVDVCIMSGVEKLIERTYVKSIKSQATSSNPIVPIR